jgi:hypothetical protein
MFDGTDLSIAYGGGSSFDASPTFQPPVQHAPPAQAPPMEPMQNKATASHAMPPEVAYAPPPAMYAQQPGAAVPPVESFWERLASKKWEVIKLVVLALVILLGVAMDRFATHYLNSYIGRAFLTETQEFLIRLGYPVLIILVLWIIKAVA